MKRNLLTNITLAAITLSTAACGTAVNASPLSFQSAGLDTPYYGVNHRPVTTRDGSSRRPDRSVEERAPSSRRDAQLASARPAERPAPTRPPIPSVSEDRYAPMRSGGGYDPQLAVSYIVDTYEMNGVEFENPAAMRIVDLYRSVQREGTVYHTTQPVVGDLVFFHNTYDANDDNRNNDWYTHVGIIESVDREGTITFLSYRQGDVVRDVMNLREPRSERVEGRPANAKLREERRDDPAWTQYYSGELFAGFGSLLGSRSDVVVIDRWDPSRSTALSAGR